MFFFFKIMIKNYFIKMPYLKSTWNMVVHSWTLLSTHEQHSEGIIKRIHFEGASFLRRLNSLNSFVITMIKSIPRNQNMKYMRKNRTDFFLQHLLTWLRRSMVTQPFQIRIFLRKRCVSMFCTSSTLDSYKIYCDLIKRQINAICVKQSY